MHVKPRFACARKGTRAASAGTLFDNARGEWNGEWRMTNGFQRLAPTVRIRRLRRTPGTIGARSSGQPIITVAATVRSRVGLFHNGSGGTTDLLINRKERSATS